MFWSLAEVRILFDDVFLKKGSLPKGEATKSWNVGRSKGNRAFPTVKNVWQRRVATARQHFRQSRRSFLFAFQAAGSTSKWRSNKRRMAENSNEFLWKQWKCFPPHEKKKCVLVSAETLLFQLPSTTRMFKRDNDGRA